MFARFVRIAALLQLVVAMAVGVWIAAWACPSWLGWMAVSLLCVSTLLAFPILLFVLVTMFLAGVPAAGRWRAMAGEWRAMTWLFWIAVPWARTRLASGAAPLPEPSRLPVVLVHGFFCNSQIWCQMERALRWAGHDVQTVNLEPLFASIDDYVPAVERTISSVLERTHAPRVILVGHSMGGLVLRAWMRAYGSERADRVLTLGTPHRGTWLAHALPFAANCRQMVPDSPWLRALHASESPTMWDKIHVAQTRHDNIVFSYAPSLLSQQVDTMFGGIGHLQLCLDDAAIDWVVRHCHENKLRSGSAC